MLPRRLDKFVKDATALSVADIREAWQQGRISLRSEGTCSTPPLSSRVFAGDTVEVDGAPVHPRTTSQVAMLHKPPRVTSTVRDPQGKADLQPWLGQLPRGMFPVGRLDRETTGLLLFTDDGDLANALLRPAHHTPKRYWLWLDEHFEHNDPRLARMTEANLEFDCVDRVGVLHQGENGAELIFTLSEGKNRQIRRLCSALGLRLNHLHRLSFGSLELSPLASGSLRSLTDSEVTALWSAAGGRSSIEQAQLAALYREAADCRAAGEPQERLEAWLSGFSLP